MDALAKLKELVQNRFDDNISVVEKSEKNTPIYALFGAYAKEDYDIIALIESLEEEEKKSIVETVVCGIDDFGNSIFYGKVDRSYKIGEVIKVMIVDSENKNRAQ